MQRAAHAHHPSRMNPVHPMGDHAAQEVQLPLHGPAHIGVRGQGLAKARQLQRVPVGGELDYLDEGTLSAAMRQRTLF